VRPAAVPEQLRRDVFRGSWAVRTGLLTWRRLEGRSWRRLLQDVYVHADVPVTHALRAEAACLLLPQAIVTGCSAAVLWGVDLAGPADDVEVTLPPEASARRLPGLRVRRASIHPSHRSRRADIPVTSAAATALRVAAALSLDDAVMGVDRMVASGIVDLEPLRRMAAAARGPGSAQARTVCRLADGLAGSPQETRLRLLMQRGGLPAPVAQFRVTDADGFVARVDFAWPEHKVAVEYDGLWHAETGQFARDRRRLNRLQAAGWRIVFVTAADLRDAVGLIARIAAALAA
jgi:G:T-mismatch repair DNA endonuclease (very short patch repair protein)